MFASKTPRMPDVPTSPGPGDYNAKYKYEFVKRSPENFGSNVAREDSLNVSI